MTGERLLSVGIDIGTTTTQLVLSRLTLRNEGAAFSVPQFAIAEKEVLYRSAIHFTPLLSAPAAAALAVLGGGCVRVKVAGLNVAGSIKKAAPIVAMQVRIVARCLSTS